MLPDMMLSADSHIVEPPDLWSSRMSADLRDRGPNVRRLDDGDRTLIQEQHPPRVWFRHS